MENQLSLGNFEDKQLLYWTAYNKAKTNEKIMFYKLLDELCSLIQEPVHTNGRKPTPLRDLLFCACLKIYSNYSARKISSDMKHASQMGFIKKVPHFNSLLNFMDNEVAEELIKRLIVISAMPLKNLERDFAIDSTGFGCYQYERWMKVRFGQLSESPEKLWRHYIKLHASIGTKTNVIASCEVTQGNVGDATLFPELANMTVDNFHVDRISADKAYLSSKNLQIAESLNFLPFIPFKINSRDKDKNTPLWQFMYDYFKNNREEFDRFYHRRSNVESTFSMIKTRLGEFLKCRNLQSQKNEVLLKCLTHNICCLVQEIYESGIKIDFSSVGKDYKGKMFL